MSEKLQPIDPPPPYAPAWEGPGSSASNENYPLQDGNFPQLAGNYPLPGSDDKHSLLQASFPSPPPPYPQSSPAPVPVHSMAPVPVHSMAQTPPRPTVEVTVNTIQTTLAPGQCSVCRKGKIKDTASCCTWITCLLLLPFGCIPGLIAFCCCCRHPKCTHCGFTY